MAATPTQAHLTHLQIIESLPQGDAVVIITTDSGADTEIQRTILAWLPGSKITRIGPWRWRVQLKLPEPPSTVQRLVLDARTLTTLMQTTEVQEQLADSRQIEEYEALPLARILGTQRQKFLIDCPRPISKFDWQSRPGSMSAGGIMVSSFPRTSRVEVTLVGVSPSKEARAEVWKRYLRLFANVHDIQYDLAHNLTRDILGNPLT